LFYPYAFLFTFLAVNLNNDVDSGLSMSDTKTTMINPKRKHDENLAEEESSNKIVRRSTSIEEGVEEIPPPTSHISLPPISTSTSASSLSSNSSTPTGEELLSSLDPLFQCYNIYDMEAFYQLLSHHADSNLHLTLKYLSNYTIEGINPVFVFCNISHECYPDATLKILERRIVNLSTASSTPTTPLDRKSSVSSPEASVSVSASVAASKSISSDGSNNSHADKSKTVVNSGSSSAATALSSTSSSSASNKIVRMEYICKFNGTIISNQDISVIYQQFLRHTEESLTSVLSAATTNATTTVSSPATADVTPLTENTSDKATSEESSLDVVPGKTNSKKKGRKKELKASDDTAKEEPSSSSSRTEDRKPSQLYANGLKHINQMKLDDLSMNLARFISQNYLVMNMNDNPTRQSSSYIFELVLTFNPVTGKVLRCDMDILAKTDVSVAQTVLPSQISRKSSKTPPTSSGQPGK
jgi:chemotaxis protein histidine kinase CheA